MIPRLGIEMEGSGPGYKDMDSIDLAGSTGNARGDQR